MLLGALGFPTLSLSGDGESIDFVAYSAALEEKAWIVILAMVLTSLFKGAMWFAPTILAFNKMSAGAAIRWSVFAFLSNFGAMFFYWILIAAMYFLALLPSGAGLFIAIPLTLISSYTGYKAMFREEQKEDAPAPPPAPTI